MLFHYKMKYNGQDQDDDHDDGLNFTRHFVLIVSDQEEQADECDFHDVDARKKLRDGVVE